jgi:HEAT repeat protein
MTENGTPERPTSDEPAERDQDFTVSSTLTQFFLIPALVVVACVGIFLFFGWLVSEERTSLDYLHDIRSGSSGRRWQAAFELAKQLNNIDRAEQQEEREQLIPEMVEAFRDAADDDPRVRRYLALALGHLGDPRAVPVLVEALSDDDPDTRIYAIWALGSAGDRRAIPPLMEMAQHDDAGIRKMAVYSLGSLGAEEARPVLQAALNDHQVDVAWNAAIALAQLGDASGKHRILQMLDRGYLESVPDMTDEQRADAMVTAMQGAVLLADPEMLDRLREISEQDPNLKVRQAAFEALDQTDKSRDE